MRQAMIGKLQAGEHMAREQLGGAKAGRPSTQNKTAHRPSATCVLCLSTVLRRRRS
jgi:hypothetical protein